MLAHGSLVATELHDSGVSILNFCIFLKKTGMFLGRARPRNEKNWKTKPVYRASSSMGKEESERARKNQKRCWRTEASNDSGVSILNFGICVLKHGKKCMVPFLSHSCSLALKQLRKSHQMCFVFNGERRK